MSGDHGQARKPLASELLPVRELTRRARRDRLHVNRNARRLDACGAANRARTSPRRGRSVLDQLSSHASIMSHSSEMRTTTSDRLSIVLSLLFGDDVRRIQGVNGQLGAPAPAIINFVMHSV